MTRNREGTPNGRDEDPQTALQPRAARRRDASRWTLVQGILAPLGATGDFAFISAALVIRYFDDGATATPRRPSRSWSRPQAFYHHHGHRGAIWEEEVFGQYLFAGEAFFWEDVVRFGVDRAAYHFIVALFAGFHGAGTQPDDPPALVAYIALFSSMPGSFLWKLGMARNGAAR